MCYVFGISLGWSHASAARILFQSASLGWLGASIQLLPTLGVRHGSKVRLVGGRTDRAKRLDGSRPSCDEDTVSDSILTATLGGRDLRRPSWLGFGRPSHDRAG